MGRTRRYDRNAAVIVNFGGAAGAEIWAHAQAVANSVAQRFGVLLSPEVNISEGPRLCPRRVVAVQTLWGLIDLQTTA